MSGYSEQTSTEICQNGHENGVVIAYAGDYRANERESANCYECGVHLISDKCFAIYAAATIEEAVAQLRAMQGRKL